MSVHFSPFFIWPEIKSAILCLILLCNWLFNVSITWWFNTWTKSCQQEHVTISTTNTLEYTIVITFLHLDCHRDCKADQGCHEPTLHVKV